MQDYRKAALSHCLNTVGIWLRLMERLYLDANIFLSMWLDEVGAGLPVPFGYYSGRLFDNAVSCRYYLITSKITVQEISEKFPFLLETMREEVSALRKAEKLLLCEFDSEAYKAAVETNRKLSNQGLKIGWKDCIHILTAQKNDATLVTWDKGMQEACRGLGLKVTDPQALNL